MARTGHAGTGFVTRRGWPKPFRFETIGEYGERSAEFEPLYFAGNMLVYSAALLLAWALWRSAAQGARTGLRAKKEAASRATGRSDFSRQRLA